MKRLLDWLATALLVVLAGLLLTDAERGEPQPQPDEALDFPATTPRGLSGAQGPTVSLDTE